MPSGQTSARPSTTELYEKLIGVWKVQAIAVGIRLGVFEKLRNGSLSSDDFAAEQGLDADRLYRLMRALAVEGFLHLEDGRVFQLTPSGQLLTSSASFSLRNLALYVGNPRNWRTWEHLELGVRSGVEVFKAVHGQSAWDFMADPANAEDTAVFVDTMSELSRIENGFVLFAYNFGGCRHVVDIGGGFGELIRGILARYPQLKGTLFDTPEVAQLARQALRGTPLEGRCEAIGGDFFGALPEGADLYTIKHVLHNWDDSAAARILQSIRRAMHPDGRLLVMDFIVPVDNRPDVSIWWDLDMSLKTAGGRERTEVEFRRLLETAGFTVRQFIPTMGPLHIIEASH